MIWRRNCSRLKGRQKSRYTLSFVSGLPSSSFSLDRWSSETESDPLKVNGSVPKRTMPRTYRVRLKLEKRQRMLRAARRNNDCSGFHHVCSPRCRLHYKHVPIQRPTSYPELRIEIEKKKLRAVLQEARTRQTQGFRVRPKEEDGDRQTDRQTDNQSVSQTKVRQIDRQTEGQTERQKDRQTQRGTDTR